MLLKKKGRTIELYAGCTRDLQRKKHLEWFKMHIVVKVLRLKGKYHFCKTNGVEAKQKINIDEVGLPAVEEREKQ